MESNKSVFEVLNAIDVNGHTEKKNNLTYLSWAWAWAEIKKRYPGAFYTIYENKDGLLYHTDGRTAWVKTGVTIEGLEHIEYLPVLDKSSHNSLTVSQLTSWDVNKAIQRSLTKACARHGLGLYIYAGEDLPEGAEDPAPAKRTTKKAAESAPAPADAVTDTNDELDLGLFKQLLKEAKTDADKKKVWDDWKEVQEYIKGEIQKADSKQALTKLWDDWKEAQAFIKPLFSERRKQLGL